MATRNDSGDRTEKPTARKLREARKHGEVHKSREVTTTVGLVAWLVVGGLLLQYAGGQLAALLDASILAIGKPFETVVIELGWSAARALTMLVIALLVPVSMLSLLAEYLQVGPVFTLEKLAPDFERLNPAEGLKRMFSTDNLVEIVKMLAKAAVLLLVAWIVLRDMMGQLAGLRHGGAAALGAALWQGTLRVLAWSAGVFALVSVVDALYQRHSFLKKMRMSRRDIRQETKENEGDPYIRARRRQLHQEWAQRNAIESARRANVLVVNPTHVAIALEYDPEEAPIPVVIGKGEDDLAADMREAARHASVPILRNVQLARALLERAEIDEIVPTDLFDAVAHAILWAREERERLRRLDAGESDTAPDDRGGPPSPTPKDDTR